MTNCRVSTEEFQNDLKVIAQNESTNRKLRAAWGEALPVLKVRGEWDGITVSQIKDTALDENEDAVCAVFQNSGEAGYLYELMLEHMKAHVASKVMDWEFADALDYVRG